jgi:riboflavin kinase / FMN adenylyltransferase
MQVHFGVELLHAEWSSAVTCVGTFDGVHLGHQAVISAAVQCAKDRGLPCALVTFDRHPAHVLAPERAPKAIASLATNIRAFERLGVSVALILPFDRALSQTPAAQFVDEVLLGRLHSEALVVGHDFALGKGREGNPQFLAERLETKIIPPFQVDEHRVSSSAIRQAVQDGDMAGAARLLGRPFEIEGVVVSGQRLGRTLGYPTINLARSFDQVTPADGVYAGVADMSKGRFKAAISVGYRPAVSGTHRTIEAYLLDYPGEEIYGYSVRLEVHDRLREELDFPSLEDLKDQIGRDVQQVENALWPPSRP